MKVFGLVRTDGEQSIRFCWRSGHSRGGKKHSITAGVAFVTFVMGSLTGSTLFSDNAFKTEIRDTCSRQQTRRWGTGIPSPAGIESGERHKLPQRGRKWIWCILACTQISGTVGCRGLTGALRCRGAF